MTAESNSSKKQSTFMDATDTPTPDVAQDYFQLHSLPHFPYLLSDEEKKELELWGNHAQLLSTGETAPQSQNEHTFLRFCTSNKPPKTRFQKLWLKYCQAAQAEVMIESLEEITQRQSTHAEELDEKVADIRRLGIAHTAVWGEVKRVKAELHEANRERMIVERALRLTIKQYEEKLGIGGSFAEYRPTEVEGWVDDWREQK